MAIVILNIVQHFAGQILFAGKVAALQNVAGKKREPNFNLVEPGSVKGKEMKNNAFVGLLKDLFSLLLRHFLPLQAAGLGHQLSNRLRHMGLEIIHNDMNFFSRIRMLFQNQPQETAKFQGTVTFKEAPQHIPLVRIESSKQRSRSMPDVTKLSEERLARQDRFIRSNPFQGLHPRLLVDTKDNALRRRLQVKTNDAKHLLFKERVLGVKPVTRLPGLQSRFFEPVVNRTDGNGFDNLFLNRRALKLPETPGLKSPAHITGRLQDQLDESVFLLRGKKRSELRSAAGLLSPLAGFLKTASAISVPYAREFQADEQFQRLKSLR